VGYAEDMGDDKTVAVTHNYTKGVSGIEGTYSYEDYGLDLLEELKAGKTIVSHDIIGELNLSDAEKNAYAALDLAASVNVPLIKKDKLHAIHFIHFNKPHHFTPQEI